MLACLNCGAKNRDGSRFCGQCGRTLRFAIQLHNPGVFVAHYRILRVIGQGGLGAVYEAEDMDRAATRVALKEILDPDLALEFQDTFAMLGGLQHDNLPRYGELFEAGGCSYLALEFVPGLSLEEVLEKQSGPLPEQTVLGYALQLCDVLDYLHKQNPPLFHLDLKPLNVRLLPNGMLKLVDFGLFRLEPPAARKMRRLLSPEYASPEQWGFNDQPFEARSDLYSLGAMLYQLLTHVKPISVIDRLASSPDPLLSPRLHNPNLSSHLANAILHTLELVAEKRTPDALSLKQELLGGADQAPTTASLTPQTFPLFPTHNPPAVDPTTTRLGRTILLTSATDNPRRVRGFRPLRTFLQGYTYAVTSVAWGPKGQFLASASEDKTIRIWHVPNDRLLHTLRGHRDAISSVAWSPDGQTLATSSWDSTIRLWTMEESRLPRSFQRHADQVLSVAWSPDGELLASAGGDGTIWIWRVSDGKPLQALRGHTGEVHSVAWSPDGNILASASWDNTVRLWMVDEERQVSILQEHTDAFNSIAWSPNGEFLASASWDSTVWLWRSADGRLLRTLQGHAGEVHCVAWSPDGEMLASAGWDNTVRIWRINDGRLLFLLQGHTGPVTSVDWSFDGQMLASGSFDKTLRLWQIEYSET